MIEHLRGRDRKLEPLGWTGREAEWIALVCLHSGVFTRTQFCHYFDTHRVRAFRFVKTLLARKQAVETEWPTLNGGGKTCRISSKAIYRALGVENIRHRRKASKPVVMRRLLSLDFILEHPGMNWLPAEQEKVEFFDELGLPRRLIPRRIYYGMVGNQKRYFALKLPLAVDPEIVTFAYVDPGHATDTELHSWGAAHVPLWDAIRAKGRQVRVVAIAAEHKPIERADRVLRAWAAAPEKDGTGMSVKQEIAAIKDGMLRGDHEFLEQWGGWHPARGRNALTRPDMKAGPAKIGGSNLKAVPRLLPQSRDSAMLAVLGWPKRKSWFIREPVRMEKLWMRKTVLLLPQSVSRNRTHVSVRTRF